MWFKVHFKRSTQFPWHRSLSVCKNGVDRHKCEQYVQVKFRKKSYILRGLCRRIISIRYFVSGFYGFSIDYVGLFGGAGLVRNVGYRAGEVDGLLGIV